MGEMRLTSKSNDRDDGGEDVASMTKLITNPTVILGLTEDLQRRFYRQFNNLNSQQP